MHRQLYTKFKTYRELSSLFLLSPFQPFLLCKVAQKNVFKFECPFRFISLSSSFVGSFYGDYLKSLNEKISVSRSQYLVMTKGKFSLRL